LSRQLDTVLPHTVPALGGHIDQIHSAPASPQRTTFHQTESPAITGSNVGNIDVKIEQAMDLVKSHLMYAVREEVELLRAKIVDLEHKVLRLEAENALLREYAPQEIVSQLSGQRGEQNTGNM